MNEKQHNLTNNLALCIRASQPCSDKLDRMPASKHLIAGRIILNQSGFSTIRNHWFWVFVIGSLTTVFLISQDFLNKSSSSVQDQQTLSPANAKVVAATQVDMQDEVLSAQDKRDVVSDLAFNAPLVTAQQQGVINDVEPSALPQAPSQQALQPSQQPVQQVVKGTLLEEPQEQSTELPKEIEVDPQELRSLLKVDINYMIEQWRQAWEAGDSETYLSFYSTQFIPSDKLSYEQWREQRKSMVVPSKKITLSLSNFDVMLDDLNKQSIVSFDQLYSASAYSDTSRKQLTLIKDEEWQIVAEKIID
ncbi:MAG: hypothetical protein KTR16_01035 [Acidiferrobacterales bacterium]|nr:hypothetical protein [Acidiferrobacterales bacterium]